MLLVMLRALAGVIIPTALTVSVVMLLRLLLLLRLLIRRFLLLFLRFFGIRVFAVKY